MFLKNHPTTAKGDIAAPSAAPATGENHINADLGRKSNRYLELISLARVSGADLIPPSSKGAITKGQNQAPLGAGRGDTATLGGFDSTTAAVRQQPTGGSGLASMVQGLLLSPQQQPADGVRDSSDEGEGYFTLSTAAPLLGNSMGNSSVSIADLLAGSKGGHSDRTAGMDRGMDRSSVSAVIPGIRSLQPSISEGTAANARMLLPQRPHHQAESRPTWGVTAAKRPTGAAAAAAVTASGRQAAAEARFGALSRRTR